MKVYYLRFTESDFVKQGDSWTTPVVDLYNNSQYKNYSTTKSTLGLNSLGDNTWTGLSSISPTQTDFGIIDNDRFIDTSSRIDIVSWDLSFSTDLVGSFPVTLSVYNSESNDNSYLDDWAFKSNITPGMVIFTVNSNRYAFFKLNWNSYGRDFSDLKATLSIRIEIDSPGINALTPEVIKLQNKFPEWMALREYDPENPTAEGKTQPTSLGGKFLNAAVGEYLADLRNKLTYSQFQTFIETADLTQKDWAYEASNVPSAIYSINGDGVQLARVSSVVEFYETNNDEDAFLWNEGVKSVFCNKKYNQLTINGEVYIQRPYQVWNTIDDIGVTVDLFRLSLEGNDSFRKRILDVYRNSPGVSMEAFKKALRRELNLWKYSGATPNSDFLGATPEVFEMDDIENNPEFFQPDGLPTNKFLELVEDLAKNYPMTWGYFRWNETFWDLDGLDHDGVKELPRVFDATPVSEEYLDSGVGDGNDLYVLKPDAHTGAKEFSAKFKVRGRKKQSRSESPAVFFDARVYGVADEVQYSNAANLSNFTVEVVIGGTTYYSNIQMSANSDLSYWQATPSSQSHSTFTLINQDKLTNVSLGLRNKTTNALYGGATPSQASYDSITSISVKPGSWNYLTSSYTSTPTQANYRLWFSDDSSIVLGYNGSSSNITISSFDVSLRNPVLVYESRISSNLGNVANGWNSTPTPVRVTLNGSSPGNGIKNYSLSLPPIPWPGSTSNRRYVIELVTSNGSDFGAYSDTTSPKEFFLDSSYINVNGLNSWVSGKQYFSSSTTSVTFSTGTGASYPVSASIWEGFEYTSIISITGTVDENGPWRNNQPQYYGNTSYVLDYFNLSRDDFNIPHTADYIITWLGITNINQPEVIVWMDTNTVKPAVADANETEPLQYSSSAIEETLDELTGKYFLNSITVKARFKPGVIDQWYPKAMSGYFYDDVEEYYMYADRKMEQATGNFKVLSGLNRLGAPIIVKAMQNATPIFDVRQVAFWESDQNPTLVGTNTELLKGNGSNQLFLAYDDVYDVTVDDLVAGHAVSLVNNSTKSNIIPLPVTTQLTDLFRVKYKVAKSFYVDNDYLASPSFDNTSKVFFDATPGKYGASNYEIHYEGSTFDPATPIDIPLNTFYTSIDEGFIFIDHDVYPLNRTEIRINPGKILADGYDYSLITISTFDRFGNPKPYQKYNVWTNYGVLDKTSVTTDRDGFGYLTLQSYSWNASTPFPWKAQLPPATPNLNAAKGGVVRFELASAGPSSQYYLQTTQTGAAQATIFYESPAQGATPLSLSYTDVGYSILTKATPNYSLAAIPSSDHVPANGFSEVYIFGQVQTPTHAGVPAAVVRWRKDRYLYDLFRRSSSNSSATPGASVRAGKVVADANGRFRIGPFVAATPSDPGVWLVAVESEYATPVSGSTPRFGSVGDIVYWQEYSDTSFGVENISGVPNAPAQYATPYWKLPMYTEGSAFPVSYDESVVLTNKQNPSINWQPPKWYAIDKYTQYQMGILGDQYNSYSPGATPNIYLDYKEF